MKQIISKNTKAKLLWNNVYGVINKEGHIYEEDEYLIFKGKFHESKVKKFDKKIPEILEKHGIYVNISSGSLLKILDIQEGKIKISEKGLVVEFIERQEGNIVVAIKLCPLGEYLAVRIEKQDGTVVLEEFITSVYVFERVWSGDRESLFDNAFERIEDNYNIGIGKHFYAMAHKLENYLKLTEGPYEYHEEVPYWETYNPEYQTINKAFRIAIGIEKKAEGYI